MAVGTGTAILAGGVASAFLGAKGAGKQADAARAAGESAAAAERYKVDRSLAATAPVRDVGNAAMNALASLYIPGWGGLSIDEGGGTTTTTRTGGSLPRALYGSLSGGGGGGTTTTTRTNGRRYNLDPLRPNAFAQLPWNRFLLDESNQVLQNALGQAGSPVGGNALRALADNTRQRITADSVAPLMQLAGFGPAGAGMAGNAIAGDQTGAIRLATGNNVANAIGGQYASLNNALQGTLGNFMTYNALGASGDPALSGLGYSPAPASPTGAQRLGF